jgi:hypothetical protein
MSMIAGLVFVAVSSEQFIFDEELNSCSPKFFLPNLPDL